MIAQDSNEIYFHTIVKACRGDECSSNCSSDAQTEWSNFNTDRKKFSLSRIRRVSRFIRDPIVINWFRAWTIKKILHSWRSGQFWWFELRGLEASTTFSSDLVYVYLLFSQLLIVMPSFFIHDYTKILAKCNNIDMSHVSSFISINKQTHFWNRRKVKDSYDSLDQKKE